MNIESAMAGDAVQSEIAAAVEQATGADSALIKPLNTLATQLTGFDAFYQGLLQYTNGVDSAARAASQVADGTARLQAGAAQVSGGAASLQPGLRAAAVSWPKALGSCAAVQAIWTASLMIR